MINRASNIHFITTTTIITYFFFAPPVLEQRLGHLEQSRLPPALCPVSSRVVPRHALLSHLPHVFPSNAQGLYKQVLVLWRNCLLELVELQMDAEVRQLGRGRQAPVPRAVEVDAVLLPQELVSNMLELVEHDGGVVDDARPPET